jgi:hypothetical protein
MTDSLYTHLTLLVDKSGSMHSIRTDAQGAVDKLIEDQKLATRAIKGGRASLLLADFSAPVESSIEGWGASSGHFGFRVAYDGDLAEAPAYTLNPSGNTALLDAIGKTIDLTGAKLRALPEDQRPGLVVFAVMTDGEENSSTKRTNESIKALIAEHEGKYAWQFLFLSASPDAFTQAGAIGISRGSTVQFAHTGVGTQSVYASTSNNIASARFASAAGQSSVVPGYTNEQRGDAKQ